MGCCASICCGKRFWSETVEYKDVRATLKTGDIILFSGGGLESLEVKLGTCSPFSHVGMIVRCEHFTSNGDNLYVWHSPAEFLQYTPDVLSNRAKQGPQLNSLKPLIKSAGGVVYVRKLMRLRKKGQSGAPSLANSVQLGDPCETGLTGFMRREDPKDYEQNTKQLVYSSLDLGPIGRNTEDTSSYFCSELIAKTYQVMGLLNSDEPSNEYTPKDLSSKNSDLHLKFGYKLTKEMKVVIH